MSNQLTVRALFERDDVKQKFKEMLGNRSTSFITSVLQITTQSKMLANADPMSIYQAAATAATLDLPLNASLGFAYIVPYKDKERGQVAQFQIGYKGFIQLAQRSGQFKSIASAPIYEGQIVDSNPLNGYVFDFSKKDNDNIIGYAARFSLLNGFEATFYMSKEQLLQHGRKYSQTFKKGFGLWSDNFEAMANKTVIKLLLSKFAPLSVDMQTAIITDQSVVNDFETVDVTHIDNDADVAIVVDKEAERIELMISDCKSVEELVKLHVHIKSEQLEIYETKFEELVAAKHS
jgi:recombination protein RecT